MIKRIKKWINRKVDNFQDWAAKWYPGVKTKVLAALSAIAAFGAVLQEYITGLPISDMLGENKALIVTGVLFTLVFWTRTLSDRNS